MYSALHYLAPPPMNTQVDCIIIGIVLDFLVSLYYRRLCFYKRVSVHRGGVPDQVHPRTRYTPWDQVHPLPPGPGAPQTRYTPRPGAPPWDQVHPPGTRYTPLGPGTPPGTRYTPLGPGTPPGTRYTSPRYGHCCGRYASYWNAFLFCFDLVDFIALDISNFHFIYII